LLKAEHGFQDMKSGLELRPVLHHLDHRIRAHVLVCWLALLLIRVAEYATDATWQRITTDTDRNHLVTITGPAGSVAHSTPLTTTQTGIRTTCHVTPPPTITRLNPV
jgi:hypothetical protein